MADVRGFQNVVPPRAAVPSTSVIEIVRSERQNVMNNGLITSAIKLAIKLKT